MNNVATATAVTAAMATEALATADRSDGDWALMADVPSHASTGVRSQKSDSAAARKSASATKLTPARVDTTAPVTKGTSNIPHAPCSRGTIIAFSLEFRKMPENAAI